METRSDLQSVAAHSGIYLIRHGAVHNPGNLFYGRLPGFRLSAQGREQAAAAGRAVARLALTALYSSPLLRARQTALQIAPFTTVRLQVSRLLNEVQTPFDGISAFSVDARGGDVYTDSGPDYEQPLDIYRRFERFARMVLRRHAGGRVAAVTHGDVIVFALVGLHGRRLEPAAKSRLTALGISGGYPATGSIIRLEFDSKGQFLQSKQIHPPARIRRNQAGSTSR